MSHTAELIAVGTEILLGNIAHALRSATSSVRNTLFNPLISIIFFILLSVSTYYHIL